MHKLYSLGSTTLCFDHSKHFREAKKKALVPFLYERVLECNSSGLKHTVTDHDITIRIPKGAVPKEKKIHLEVGIALFGPFNFPENTHPISPIVWLCIIEENVELQKPIQLILPHFLTQLSEDQLHHHQVCFATANHKYLISHHQIAYNFDKCDSRPLFASVKGQSYGVLVSKHFCYCTLVAQLTPELTKNAAYELARIETSSQFDSVKRYEVCFCAMYALPTCLQVCTFKLNKRLLKDNKVYIP